MFVKRYARIAVYNYVLNSEDHIIVLFWFLNLLTELQSNDPMTMLIFDNVTTISVLTLYYSDIRVDQGRKMIIYKLQISNNNDILICHYFCLLSIQRLWTARRFLIK